MKKHKIRNAILGCIILGIGSYFVVEQIKGKRVCVIPVPQEGKIGGPFRLQNQEGAWVTERSFGDKYLMIYFGHRSCPDVCPTTLQTIQEALKLVGKYAHTIQPIFVTVDPKQDTAEELKQFLIAYPGVVGLTGTQADIDRMKKNFKIEGQEDEGGKMPDQPDHASMVYLMDPKGAYLLHFGHKTTAKEMAIQLKTFFETDGLR